MVASEMPKLPRTFPVSVSAQQSGRLVTHVLEEHIYRDRALAISQNTDRMNAGLFFNYFGSVTVKNNVGPFMAIADIFKDKFEDIKDAAGLQVYIVYNPLTVLTIDKRHRYGGNALGIYSYDRPLTSKPQHPMHTSDIQSHQHQLALD